MKSVIRYLVLLVLLVMPWLAHAQSSEPFVFHAGATEDAPGGVMNASHYSTIVVQIEGTFTGSVLFEKKTKDATGWVAVQCTNAADRTVSETSATAVGYWECPGGAYNFRARADWDSGTIVVTGHGTIAVSRSGGGGGSGSVTSVDASGGVETASGSAITGTGTIRGKLCVRAVTGTTDTITANDRGCIVTYTNADPIAVSIAEAGTTGFESGFYFQPVNLGAGTVTITPSTSTIQAWSDLDLATGKSTTIASDGTNYVHAPGLGLTAEAQSLADVITINRTFGGAVSAATGPQFGSNVTSRYLVPFDDPTTGLTLECVTPGGVGHCDKGQTIQAGFKSFIQDASLNRMTNFEPNAATSYEQWALGTKKILAAWDVPMEAHAGAATMALAQPVTGEAKKYWGTLTDSASDMFSFSFTATKAMEGATTATVRLVGVSTAASPANDVQLECSLVSARPGTDTTASHSTSNKQTVTLTPAVQNRRVSAASSAITINGTVAANAIIDGVCNVNAGGTTSTQLANFFLLGTAHIQWLKSSMSN